MVIMISFLGNVQLHCHLFGNHCWCGAVRIEPISILIHVGLDFWVHKCIFGMECGKPYELIARPLSHIVVATGSFICGLIDLYGDSNSLNYCAWSWHYLELIWKPYRPFNLGICFCRSFSWRSEQLHHQFCPENRSWCSTWPQLHKILCLLFQNDKSL